MIFTYQPTIQKCTVKNEIGKTSHDVTPFPYEITSIEKTEENYTYTYTLLISNTA